MGNYTRTMKWILCFVFVAAAIAATPSEEPYLEPATDELIQTGKASAHQMNTEAANDINPKKEGTGRFKKTANFPGAPYGLPGYKESHDWVNDIDYFNPLIFDWQFYAAEYKLTGKTETEVKTDWLNVGLKADAVYPKCRQGNKMFSLNMYYRANPLIKDKTGGNCKKILTQYLKEGLFAGAKKEDPAVEARIQAAMDLAKWLKYLQDNVRGSRIMGGYGRRRRYRRNYRTWWLRRAYRGGRRLRRNDMGTPAATFTWWMKVHRSRRWWEGIFQYGYRWWWRSPGVWLYPGYRKRIHFRMSQRRSWNWGCDPGASLPLRRWTHIAIVIRQQAGSGNGEMQLYYDGKSVGHCKSSCKTTLRRNSIFWVAQPWYYSAHTYMRDLTYYGGVGFDNNMVAAEYNVGKSRLRTMENEMETLVLKKE